MTFLMIKLLSIHSLGQNTTKMEYVSCRAVVMLWLCYSLSCALFSNTNVLLLSYVIMLYLVVPGKGLAQLSSEPFFSIICLPISAKLSSSF